VFGFGAAIIGLTGLDKAATAATPSVWEHKGSTVYLIAEGEKRDFQYNQPRQEMLEAGAEPGSLLFTGMAVDGRYVGTAYVFSPQCGRIPYQVSGPILDNYRRVVLKGQAPRLDANCRTVGYYTDVLEFSYVRSGF
jgi:hypothetical protein